MKWECMRSDYTPMLFWGVLTLGPALLMRPLVDPCENSWADFQRVLNPAVLHLPTSFILTVVIPADHLIIKDHIAVLKSCSN